MTTTLNISNKRSLDETDKIVSYLIEERPEKIVALDKESSYYHLLVPSSEHQELLAGDDWDSLSLSSPPPVGTLQDDSASEENTSTADNNNNRPVCEYCRMPADALDFDHEMDIGVLGYIPVIYYHEECYEADFAEHVTNMAG